jgi:hypothetical protein
MITKLEFDLKRPFPVAKIRWRQGGGGKELAYITARDVMDRLDEAVGAAYWQTKYQWIGDRMICELSIKIDDEWITKSDGAGDSNIEGEKGGISDALKRAGVAWSIARYLYHPSCFDINKQPAVWATPEGFDEHWKKKGVEFS